MFSLWEEVCVSLCVYLYVCVSLFRGWIGGGGGYILGWYDWNPPMPPCGGNEPEDKQRLAWNFMHWESVRAYIRPGWSFVIINLYIYGCKYVIRRRVLSISLWLGCALWHIDQLSWGRERQEAKVTETLTLDICKTWPWMSGSYSASLVISLCRGIKGT